MRTLPYSARLALWLAGWGALLALSSALIGNPPFRDRPAPLSERLLGPVARLAAAVEWARSDHALRRGRTATAYARAESALRLAPGDARGWAFLAHHFVYERGAVGSEPDPAARRRWILAGLDLLARGERESREPARLAFERGIACAFQASLPEADRAWPESAARAWEEAAAAFERAASLGEPRAAAAAERARALSSAPR